MKIVILPSCLFCFLFSLLLTNAIPIDQPLMNRGNNYDSMLALLPLYGGTKLEKIITKRTLEKIRVLILSFCNHQNVVHTF